MNERQWWSSHVQPRVHNPAKRQIAWKQQDAFIKGRPDVLFSIFDHINGHMLTGLLELKYDSAWPARHTTLIDVGLTGEQYRHLQIWYQNWEDARAAMVLFGVGKDWFLFPHDSEIVKPGSKWSRADIIAGAVAIGIGYNSLSDLWLKLLSPRWR